MDDSPRIDGVGIYPGDVVKLICGVTDGEPVGPKNNTTWHKIINKTRPEQGEFWENDHYFDTPNKAGELAPEEKNCNEKPPKESKPDFKGCYYNMKAPTKKLTFSYEGDHRYYGNAWQAAKNWTDLGSGITVKPGDSDAYIRFKDMYSTEKGRKFYGRADVSDTPEWTGPLTSPPKDPQKPSYITIEVNQAYMDKLDDAHRTYALAHEVGHALGLAHTNSDKCDSSKTSIMQSGGSDVPTRTVITPQNYDKIQLEQLYGK